MTDQLNTPSQVQVPALFKLLAERIPGFAWCLDTDLRLTAGFGAGLAALNVQPSQFIGKTIFEYFQSNDDALPGVAVHRRALQGEMVDCQDSFLGRTYRAHIQPLLDETGNVIGCIGFAQDITEQKQAEDELRRSEATWRSVIANVPAQVGTVDRGGTILFLNRPAPGLNLEDVIGTSVFEYLQPEHCAQARECIEHVFRSGETVVNESLATGPHGTQAWYETRLGPVKVDGQVVAATLISSDITERKQAETALRESERRLTTLMSNLPGMAYRRRNDPPWTMMFVSDGCSQLTGHPVSAFLDSKNVTLGDLIHPDDRQAVWDEVQQALAERRRFQLEYRIRTAHGEEKWVWEQGVGVFSDAGELLALEGLITDITERRRAEDALRHAHDELEQKIKERTAELEQANRQLRTEAAERQRAEELLAEERAFLRQVIDITPDIILVKDREGRYVLGNEAAARFFGSTIQDLVGKTDCDLLLRRNPATDALVIAEQTSHNETDLQVIENQQPVAGQDIRITDATGQTHWFMAFKTPVIEADGTCNRMLIAATDITERKQAEEALRESEAKYRALVESSPDAVAMLDLQGRIVFVSERAVELHGALQPDELTGRQGTDFVAESGRDKFRASIARLIDEGVHRNAEHKLLRRDGTTFDAEISSAVISDAAGKPEAFMAVYRNVSERKRAEELMRQTLDQLATIYDGIIEGLVITDMETKRFVRANAAFCRMLGYTEEELRTKAIKDIQPAEEAANDERRFQAAAEGRVSINEDGRVLRKDGSIFFADITGHRIFYGERPCLLALFRDVTERKQAEEKLKAEQRALRRMVMASDRERRLITYEIHDGVAQQLLGAKMLFESCQPGRKSKAADAYREGMAALMRAASEVRRLMNWLRTPVLDKFGVAAAVEDVAAQLRLTPDAPEIECRLDVQFKRLEPTLENSLFRIAQEAMTNACRHSQSEKIRVQLTQQGDEVTLEVRDWGVGFDRDLVQENRFGLEGIRERCRVLGGKLSIKSKPGEGTTVRVKFPVVEATDNRNRADWQQTGKRS